MPRLEELDVDGAIQEAASKVDASRASFLRKAGVGAGAFALSGAALLGSLALHRRLITATTN